MSLSNSMIQMPHKHHCLSLVDIGGSYIDWGIYVAAGLPFVFWAIHRFTRWGYEVSIVGASPRAGRYSGISVRRVLILSMLVGGALGGLAGTIIGIAATMIYAGSQHWSIQIPALALYGGVSAALFIGAIAGLYPSMRAARLSPTEALRTV